jgi:quercetin dioxygenase-like cupin family protein
MIIANESEVLATVFNHPEAKAAAMKALIGEQQGWSDYVLRIIELENGGHSPRHAHPWPHINFMLEGRGVLLLEGREHPVVSGSYAYVPAGSEHQYRNTGADKFRFICIVPKEGHR